ncbi:large ribosomal subunit protein mL62-like isoform X2 [Dysidea avara]|uniref:large ribosomal subunit protein mL62-like isoform X2 n=1 Tax=Dysidea avara TaxID=196820 RepID=UPI00332A57B4
MICRRLAGHGVFQHGVAITKVKWASSRSYDIPKEKIMIKFVRSSGPGGQNVNKLNTKAFVKFHIRSADWLSDRVKTRLHEMFSSRINQAGEISMTSDRFREQHRNLDDALAKMYSLIEQAAEEPSEPSAATQARWRALKRKSDKLRRTAKKYHSDKKTDRALS